MLERYFFRSSYKRFTNVGRSGWNLFQPERCIAEKEGEKVNAICHLGSFSLELVVWKFQKPIEENIGVPAG
eukprot:5037896-Amphidinium_carterae.1